LSPHIFEEINLKNTVVETHSKKNKKVKKVFEKNIYKENKDKNNKAKK
jgi:hypothetical protein